MVDTNEFLELLASRGVESFCGVPDSLLADFCACVSQQVSEGRNIICANEGNAVALASGWYISTGKPACVYMQNSGEGNAVNPLLSLADPDVYSIPMLLLIGWRGEPGTKDEPQHVKQGKVTITLLEAMGTPYVVLDGDDWERQLDGVLGVMFEESRPVALVIKKGTFTTCPFVAATDDCVLTREEMLDAFLDVVGADDLLVSTTGKESRELFELRDVRGDGHSRDFLTVGSMGHTLSIALGIALGCERNVWCLDGDGSMLMHMGSLAVSANKADNLHYIVNDNGAHESVGGQPTVSRKIDIAGLLRSCGWDPVFEADDKDSFAECVRALSESRGGALVVHTRQGSRADLGRPTTTPIQNKEELMRFMRR